MMSGTEERILKKEKKVKVKNFPGVTIDDMYDYIKPLLKRCPDNIILYVETVNTVNEPSKMVLDKLLNLKKFIEHTLPESNVVISNLITRTDNGKAFLTVIKTNEHLHGLQVDVIDSGNITSNKFNKGGLHLNPRGLGKLVNNFIRGIKNSLKNDTFNEIRQKNLNRIIIAHLNVNSIRNKLEMLKEVVGNKIDILLISETKLEDTFPLN